ncbi:ABI family, member 3a [Diretmus argenteus]
MKEQNFNEEVTKILQEAPSARRALQENYNNLLNVADYCCDNYIQSGEGNVKAFEETKNFTTQSLASVAYQISMLANSVLRLLDAQTNQLRHMESSINLIGQTVEMHKEKVSRREIGVFTAVRRVPRGHKILPPPTPPINTQLRPPYSRCPINYQQLDTLGHGMKSLMGLWQVKPPEPVQCPVAPSVSGFGKPVAPPTVPTWPTSPECDVITTLLDDAPPPPLAIMAQDDVIDTPAPPPPLDSSVELTPPLPPPPPPPPPPPTEVLANHNTPPLTPPLSLETVVEENGFPPPSPPPPSFDDVMPPPASEGLELPAPPPPPSQEVEVPLQSRRSRRRSPPSSRSLSLRVRSGPASRCRYTRSLFLPTVQSLMIPPPPPYPPPLAPPLSSSSSCRLLPLSSSSSRFCLPARLQHLDLEIPAPPPPPLFDAEGGFDDIMPPLPPPVDYDTNAPAQYMEKVVALYTYEAAKPDDLSFTEGDVIYLTCRHDDGWCEGIVNGNQGFFPENYVQSSG